MQDKLKTLLTAKKQLVIIIASILAVVILGAVTVLVLSKTGIIGKQPATTETAKDLKTNAIQALDNKDKETAKKLFEEANQQYKELNDTNNVIDTEAQLYMLEHAK